MSTRWTLVLRANASSPEGRVALSDLCEAYYQPVFVFLRRMGFDTDMARDHAHSFFAHLLARGFPGPDPDRGRFRSYLLGAVKYFVSNLLDHARREKRGGGVEHDTLDQSHDGSPALMIGDPAIAPGMNEGAVKVAVHRLRKRFRELLRQEIAHTLSDDADGDDELRYLCLVHG